ncbi:DUF4214 domain-containing protein [Roseiterribacter gracilis]|uniref:DUF4214 domain-containing protein n=1 Tax=Roseiterribacter gracilis TaxID=2812848 RepID=A0A8S8XGX1_9PROT|nr:hypothetical protein TMPK1_26220 [Rhodospirillales bacterium TMPK1]
MATADFVSQLFQNMFGRAPSTTELSSWVSKIDSGAATSNQAVLDLLNSTEGANALAIERLYQAAFGRTPDLAGFKVQLAAGQSAEVLARNFVNSAEFNAAFLTGSAFDVGNFVTKLYTNILGRAPDPVGQKVQVDFYSSLLAAGRSDVDARAALLQNFANSPELLNNLSVNFDKAVLLWAGLDNTIPVSTIASPSTTLQQFNAIPLSTMVALLNDGINGNDFSALLLINNQIKLGTAGSTVDGTSSGDTITADMASLAGSTIRGAGGIDILLVKNITSDATVALDNVEQIVVTAASAPVKLTLNVANATAAGHADALNVVAANGANKVWIDANGIETIDYEADGAPNSAGSVIDFTGNSFLTNLTVHGSQNFAISGFAGNLTPGLKVDATAATGTGTLDLRSYFPGATIRGGSGGNTLFGGAGNDTIVGGSGNDVIVAGAGADMLTGGGGDDLFRFNFNNGATFSADSTLNMLDVITDFTKARAGATSGFDRIQIGELPVGGKLSIVGDQTGTFNNFTWSVVRGVFNSNAGGLHLNGGSLASTIADLVAPNKGDAFVYSTGDFTVGDTYLFVQGGDIDLLVRLKDIPFVGTLSQAADGAFYIS